MHSRMHCLDHKCTLFIIISLLYKLPVPFATATIFKDKVKHIKNIYYISLFIIKPLEDFGLFNTLSVAFYD